MRWLGLLRLPNEARALAGHLRRLAARGSSAVYLKSHPHQFTHRDDYQSILTEIVPEGFELREAPADTLLEVAACKLPDARFHIDHSSFGIYAHELGRHVERYNARSRGDLFSQLFPDIPFSEDLSGVA